MTATRFVIYGQGRTGSTLLVSLLNAHPQVRCYEEWFHPNQWQSRARHPFKGLAFRYPLIYVRARVLLARRPAVGFKLMTSQNERLGNFLARLAAQDWRVIYLRRTDRLTRALSAAVLRATGVSHSHLTPQSEGGNIRIDPQWFLRLLHKDAKLLQREQLRLQDIPHLALIYEDDLADAALWPVTARRLCDYLNLPAVPLRTTLTKTWAQPYANLISNYDELLDLARQHGYGEW